MSQQTRLLIGAVVFLGGIFVLARGYLSTRSLQNAEIVVSETTELVQKALDPTGYTLSPTAESMPNVIEQIKRSVIEEGRQIRVITQFGPTGIDDLGEAFAERLRFLTVPNLDRDFRASVSRGDPLGKKEWFDRYAPYELEVLSQSELPAMNPSGVRLSVLHLGEDGIDSEKTDRLENGFGVTIGTRGDRLPVPEDPVRAGLVAIEIVLPMMSMDMRTRKMTTAILGYRFAWNTRMQKWIPYESVVYKRPMSAFAPPRL